jgi:hypothetical protein
MQGKMEEMSRDAPVPVRLDGKTVILVRREKFDRLGEEGCRQAFTDRRRPSGGNIECLFE